MNRLIAVSLYVLLAQSTLASADAWDDQVAQLLQDASQAASDALDAAASAQSDATLSDAERDAAVAQANAAYTAAMASYTQLTDIATAHASALDANESASTSASSADTAAQNAATSAEHAGASAQTANAWSDFTQNIARSMAESWALNKVEIQRQNIQTAKAAAIGDLCAANNGGAPCDVSGMYGEDGKIKTDVKVPEGYAGHVGLPTDPTAWGDKVYGEAVNAQSARQQSFETKNANAYSQSKEFTQQNINDRHRKIYETRQKIDLAVKNVDDTRNKKMEMSREQKLKVLQVMSRLSPQEIKMLKDEKNASINRKAFKERIETELNKVVENEKNKYKPNMPELKKVERTHFY